MCTLISEGRGGLQVGIMDQRLHQMLTASSSITHAHRKFCIGLVQQQLFDPVTAPAAHPAAAAAATAHCGQQQAGPDMRQLVMESMKDPHRRHTCTTA
jgi:hypothetical protein